MTYVLLIMEGLEIEIIMISKDLEKVREQFNKQWQQHRLHPCITTKDHHIQCEQCGCALEIHFAQEE